MAAAAGILASSVEVKLERADRSYVPGEVVRGEIVVRTHHERMAYGGINVTVEGSTNLHLNAKNVGLFEAFYSSIKPQVVFWKEIKVAGAGVALKGETVFEFQVELAQKEAEVDVKRFFDTYHGVYINTDYVIHVEVVRGLLSTNLVKEIEFIVQVPSSEAAKERSPAPVHFNISPQTLENLSVRDRQRVPRFDVTGIIHRLECPITEPFTGEITINESEIPISSIEVQLVRIETVSYAEGVAQEATEIQSIQIADGNICRKFAIPIFLVFPRLFTCPTMVTDRYMVEFEINLIIFFSDGTVLTENFPIELFRPSSQLVDTL